MALVAGLVIVVIALLAADLVFFARGREPTFRESVVWSVGWFVLGVAVTLPMWALDSGEGAVNYLTVYLIERTLSLDNLFVFLLVFGAFAVPHAHRGRLLFWGIALALAMRGLAILVGVELIERFHWVVYVLGATLLFLAWRILRGSHEDIDPGQGRTARAVRRVLPVGEHYHGARFFA
ncbi:MAG TPA: TerC family protein, partial [Solirubrobacteraceae bacterium]|nr:TerC family protein [Solirubrobacteraceae bacterium]